MEIDKVRVCKLCGEFGHLPKDCRTEVCIDGKALQDKIKQCRKCGYFGHPERECLKKSPPKTSGTNSGSSSDSSSSGSSSDSSSSSESSSSSDSESGVARKKIRKGPRFSWDDVFQQDVGWMLDNEDNKLV